jgi:aromatic ring-opening dioxygenase catalytic subunit (LigB family)
VIIDSHWESTVEHILSAHEHRSGHMTSSELPRGMAGIPYDYDGDPELAKLAAKIGDELGTPTHASQDDYLPVYYATVNLVHYLHKGEKVVSISVVQTGEADDFLTMGRALGEAAAQLDRNVVVLASGGMSHTFWPLSQISEHEASDPSHIVTPEARAADERRVEWMKEGAHRRIVEEMDDYMPHNPEGDFGHYLMMLGAVGGPDCVATGEMFSDYENATGTGQVHVWFERPDGGWTG